MKLLQGSPTAISKHAGDRSLKSGPGGTLRTGFSALVCESRSQSRSGWAEHVSNSSLEFQVDRPIVLHGLARYLFVVEGKIGQLICLFFLFQNASKKFLVLGKILWWCFMCNFSVARSKGILNLSRINYWGSVSLCPGTCV